MVEQAVNRPTGLLGGTSEVILALLAIDLHGVAYLDRQVRRIKQQVVERYRSDVAGNTKGPDYWHRF